KAARYGNQQQGCCAPEQGLLGSIGSGAEHILRFVHRLAKQAWNGQLQNRGNDRGANGQTCLPIVAQREQRDAQQGALPLTSVGSCNMSPSIAARTVAASLEGDQGNNPDVN